jgi:IS4 transposase
MLLDHDGYMPSYAIITDGKKGDGLISKMFRFEKGTVVVMDRGYNDYDWFAQLSGQEVFFVTRLKDNAAFTDVPEKARKAEGDRILSDRVITFDKHKADADGNKPEFRIIRKWIDAKHGIFTFLTNNMEFDATTIGDIYKERWQIELFFKAIKQNLKIKTFLGTSENAVKTQIWTALIAMLILRCLQLLSTAKWSLSNLVAMLRQQLFVYRDLLTWLNKPKEGPPQLAGIEQLSFDFSFTWTA